MKTYKTNQNPDAIAPVLVKNPFTGDHINVLPLFERMQEEAYSMTTGPEEMVKTLQFILDRTATVILTREDEPGEWAAVNRELLLLRKMFERMSVVKA